MLLLLACAAFTAAEVRSLAAMHLPGLRSRPDSPRRSHAARDFIEREALGPPPGPQPRPPAVALFGAGCAAFVGAGCAAFVRGRGAFVRGRGAALLPCLLRGSCAVSYASSQSASSRPGAALRLSSSVFRLGSFVGAFRQRNPHYMVNAAYALVLSACISRDGAAPRLAGLVSATLFWANNVSGLWVDGGAVNWACCPAQIALVALHAGRLATLKRRGDTNAQKYNARETETQQAEEAAEAAGAAAAAKTAAAAEKCGVAAELARGRLDWPASGSVSLAHEATPGEFDAGAVRCRDGARKGLWRVGFCGCRRRAGDGASAFTIFGAPTRFCDLRLGALPSASTPA
ncbi:hypothetical protein M885DRAFT_607638 [Pelagophyceae sp. CCMP2097]|nr:hypothetical protein M885DRAFT_607638 [Pelagophyceae sp. CCMP2097]